MRRALEIGVLCVCLTLLLRGWGVEPYQVPTGSMAPTLAGHHRAADCPRCGCRVVVGLHSSDRVGAAASSRWYRPVCPNCGSRDVPIHQAPAARGDRVFVNRHVFALRRPRRWEVVVFRLLGIVLVKRVVGLPGETVALEGGDLYIDGELARKDLATLRHLRLPVFDIDFAPAAGWAPRWEVPPWQPDPHPLSGNVLRLDGTGGGRPCVAVYRHADLDSGKSGPIRDEYAYNGGDRRPTLPVHDFLVEGRLTVEAGEGAVLLGLTDGADHVVVEIPVGAGQVRVALARDWADLTPVRALATADRRLRVGAECRFELAFVDRRVSLALDGELVLPPVDLPPAAGRGGVARPALLGARGVRAAVRNYRLFRDIHYTDSGTNGVGGKVVSLGAEQYFVLGDNSPASQDSRHWPEGGVVSERALIGKPFLAQPHEGPLRWLR